MFFSCIIPVYNTEINALDNCINSILKQTYTDYEVLIIDDGSNSETALRCDMYSSNNVRIRVIHQDNLGLAGARNTGILNAKGKWLVHIDSDDWIDDNLLEKVAHTIYENKVDIVFWGYRACNGENKREYKLINKDIIKYSYEEYKDSLIEAIMLANSDFNFAALNTTWAKAYNRKFVIDNALLFNLELRRAQDVIYNLYAFMLAKAIAYVDTAGSNYRIDNESLSRGYNDQTLDRLRKTANACLDFTEKYPNNKKYTMAAYSFCRKCFRIIITQDFMNINNPQTGKVKKERFKKALLLEPFHTAYSTKCIKAKPDKDWFETALIARGNYSLLYLYWKVRNLARKMIKRSKI